MRFASYGVDSAFTWRNLQRSLLILLILSPLLIIPGLKTFGFILLLSFVNLVFSFVTHPLRRSGLGIELTTVLTVLFALAFGSGWGVIAGLFLIAAEYAGTMRLSFLSIVTIPAVMLMGAVVPLFGDVPIASLGLWAAVIYNLVTFSLCLFIRKRVFGMAVFAVTNIFWNKFLFSLASSFF